MSIFALATAPGTSGLAVIRVSGKEAFKVAQTVTKFKKIKPRVANFSSFYDHKNKLIDKYGKDHLNVVRKAIAELLDDHTDD